MPKPKESSNTEHRTEKIDMSDHRIQSASTGMRSNNVPTYLRGAMGMSYGDEFGFPSDWYADGNFEVRYAQRRNLRHHTVDQGHATYDRADFMPNLKK